VLQDRILQASGAGKEQVARQAGILEGPEAVKERLSLRPPLPVQRHSGGGAFRVDAVPGDEAMQQPGLLGVQRVGGEGGALESLQHTCILALLITQQRQAMCFEETAPFTPCWTIALARMQLVLVIWMSHCLISKLLSQDYFSIR
jgi:hypothetical protein